MLSKLRWVTPRKELFANSGPDREFLNLRASLSGALTSNVPPWEAMVRVNGRPVAERVIARINRGEAPPSMRLPESKAEFPKMLCLDMWVWIELAKVHYRKSQDAHAAAALAAIRDATKSGRLTVPICTVNLDEATKHPSEGRRMRLATFMVDLSGNFSCYTPLVTRDHQIDQAVAKHFLGGVKLPSIRPYLVEWSLDAAGLGRPPRLPMLDGHEHEEIVRQFLREPEQSITALVYALGAEHHKKMESLERGLVPFEEAARAADGDKPVEERMREAFSYFFKLKSSYLTRIAMAMATRQLPPQAYVDMVSDADRVMRFAEDLHQLYIWTRIKYERDRNADDKPALNDSRDGEFLGQAITYGNVVVTESRWADLANRTKVAERYGTKVLGRIGTLPGVLKEEGCL